MPNLAQLVSARYILIAPFCNHEHFFPDMIFIAYLGLCAAAMCMFIGIDSMVAVLLPLPF